MLDAVMSILVFLTCRWSCVLPYSLDCRCSWLAVSELFSRARGSVPTPSSMRRLLSPYVGMVLLITSIFVPDLESSLLGVFDGFELLHGCASVDGIFDKSCSEASSLYFPPLGIYRLCWGIATLLNKSKNILPTLPSAAMQGKPGTWPCGSTKSLRVDGKNRVRSCAPRVEAEISRSELLSHL